MICGRPGVDLIRHASSVSSWLCGAKRHVPARAEARGGAQQYDDPSRRFFGESRCALSAGY
jgi:hypothetical protein